MCGGDVLSPVYNPAFLIAAGECGISLKIESNDKKIDQARHLIGAW